MTGVLGDTVAKLTFDNEFQGRRSKGSGSVGQGLEGMVKVRKVALLTAHYALLSVRYLTMNDKYCRMNISDRSAFLCTLLLGL